MAQATAVRVPRSISRRRCPEKTRERTPRRRSSHHDGPGARDRPPAEDAPEQTPWRNPYAAASPEKPLAHRIQQDSPTFRARQLRVSEPSNPPGSRHWLLKRFPHSSRVSPMMMAAAAPWASPTTATAKKALAKSAKTHPMVLCGMPARAAGKRLDKSVMLSSHDARTGPRVSFRRSLHSPRAR